MGIASLAEEEEKEQTSLRMQMAANDDKRKSTTPVGKVSLHQIECIAILDERYASQAMRK
jgi:hypothetical protein